MTDRNCHFGIFAVLGQNSVFSPNYDFLQPEQKEGIIDNLETWLRLREARNHLEHDYPAELEQSLLDLQFCIIHYTTLMQYYNNVKSFILKHGSR